MRKLSLRDCDRINSSHTHGCFKDQPAGHNRRDGLGITGDGISGHSCENSAQEQRANLSIFGLTIMAAASGGKGGARNAGGFRLV